MKAALNIARPLCASVLLLLGLLLGGCGQISRSLYLAGYDRDIQNATRAIEAARDDVHRAAAYTKRGSAYSEKARYSRAFELISADEYSRLFGLAIKDPRESADMSAQSLPPGSRWTILMRHSGLLVPLPIFLRSRRREVPCMCSNFLTEAGTNEGRVTAWAGGPQETIRLDQLTCDSGSRAPSRF